MVYNVTALTDGANIVEWAAVFNSWTGGTLFSGIIVIGFLITLSISKRTNTIAVSMVTAGFIWSIIATLLWAVQINGLDLVPTALPVFFGIITGVGAFMHIIKDGVGNV